MSHPMSHTMSHTVSHAMSHTMLSVNMKTCTTEEMGEIEVIHFTQIPNNVPAYMASQWTFENIKIKSSSYGNQLFNFGGYAKPNIIYDIKATEPSIIIEDEGTR